MRSFISEEHALLVNPNLGQLIMGISAVLTNVKKELNFWKTVLVACRLELSVTQDRYSMKKASVKTVSHTPDRH